MSEYVQYTSFLVRMWRTVNPDHTACAGEWHSEIEHIQTRRGWTFSSLDELIAFLKDQAEFPQGVAYPEEEP